jgi:hypothetical protein
MNIMGTSVSPLSERCLNLDYQVLILEYLRLPVSPTSVQSACQYRGVSVPYCC